MDAEAAPTTSPQTSPAPSPQASPRNASPKTPPPLSPAPISSPSPRTPRTPRTPGAQAGSPRSVDDSIVKRSFSFGQLGWGKVQSKSELGDSSDLLSPKTLALLRASLPEASNVPRPISQEFAKNHPLDKTQELKRPIDEALKEVPEEFDIYLGTDRHFLTNIFEGLCGKFDSSLPEDSPQLKYEDLRNGLLKVGLFIEDELVMSASERKGLKKLFWTKEQFFLHCQRRRTVYRAFRQDLVIPNWSQMTDKMTEIFDQVKSNEGGNVATYIPQLARVSPEKFGVSFCSTSGQRFNLGDAQEMFCVQSCSKAISYCIALQEHGRDVVHQFIGKEPSGRNFNERILDSNNRPHNPLINSGAIMTASLIKPHWSIDKRWDYVLDIWKRLSGGQMPVFDNATYLSERGSADRNWCLGYMMKELDGFPSKARGFSSETNLQETLEFYFMCCSLMCTTEAISIIAATLSNNGVNPMTEERIFDPWICRDCLSLMMTCGMYDYSGTWAFKLGFPSKSGVGGGLLVVLPRVGGLATWSPKLDSIGNSVRGVDFCTRMAEVFSFHHLSDVNSRDLIRVTQHEGESIHEFKVEQLKLRFNCSIGRLNRVIELVGKGVDVNCTDYDYRGPLHLAVCQNHVEVAAYLLSHGSDPDLVDRYFLSPRMYSEDSTPAMIALFKKHPPVEMDEVKSQGKTTLSAPPTNGGRRMSTGPESDTLLFRALDVNGRGYLDKVQIINQLKQSGISRKDPRVVELWRSKLQEGRIYQGLFNSFLRSSQLFGKAFTGSLVIPEWESFARKLFEICTEVKNLPMTGHCANYIRTLKETDPNLFSVSVTTIDGQRFDFGDKEAHVTLQSVANVFSYIISRKLVGDKVHDYVGFEPSGSRYDTFNLNTDGVPHNPLINAGAISTCGVLVDHYQDESKAFARFCRELDAMAGKKVSHFSNECYLAEKATSNRNLATSYLLKHSGVFEPSFDITKALDHYVMTNSIEMTTHDLSLLGACMAAGGRTVHSNEQVVPDDIIKNTLSLMHSCGYYDFSGSFAFDVGIPSKSSVSGATLMVIPNVAAIAVYSPPIDDVGNSVKGLEFCKRFGATCNFHTFEGPINYSGDSVKTDPREQEHSVRIEHIADMLAAASVGDWSELKHVEDMGLVSLDDCDYDGRSALHVAAVEGHEPIVRYLLRKVSNPAPTDRWGHTPRDEAIRSGHGSIAALFPLPDPDAPTKTFDLRKGSLPPLVRKARKSVTSK